MKNAYKTIFPNTAAGAEQALRELVEVNAEGAIFEKDPHVANAWRAETPNDEEIAFVILNLAGYADAWGEIAGENDHEEIYREELE